MATKETILTAEGLEKLKDELAQRKGVIREEIVERLKEARAQGDLSENSEYDQAKEDQGKNEGRIIELEQMIKTATIIDDSASKDAGVVSLGSTVILEDMETGEQETYTIVGTTEADPFANRISNESPVGAAILSKKVHSTVIVKTPAGELSYKIIEIKSEGAISMAENKHLEDAAALTDTEINEQMQVRIDKMHKIEEHGWKPFGHRFLFTHRAADIAAQFDELSEKETEVTMAGRVMAIRGHGKTCFMDMQDKTGRIQVYVRKDVIGEENYALIKLMDIGDTVGITGTAFRTHMGELSIKAASVEMLSKSLRPLPEKWHGLKAVSYTHLTLPTSFTV